MKIVVLNGSPKGDVSVTMQYVHYIQKKFPQHELKIINVSQRIKKLARDEQAFQQVLDDVRSADGVLWASPVYFLLVPSQYKRFIELIAERGAESIFERKYTAALTTSIHFYDHTAHNYLHAVCDDLEMRYVGSFSADMRDLMGEKGRAGLLVFAAELFEAIENQAPTSKSYRPAIWREFEYYPGAAEVKVDAGGKRILIVTDAEAHQTNLLRMIERFKASFAQEIPVVNLNDLDIKGGCLGCLHCGYDNHCAYEGQDDYVEFYNTQIKTADILIFAGAIRDRYLSSRWKMFFDRSFFNGHTPTLSGKQIGCIISGPLSQNQNLRQVLQGWLEIQPANIAGFVSDEYGDAAYIDGLLQDLARRLVRFAAADYVRPPTFLGVAGIKLFRDEIWGRLRMVFQADHRAYKRLGLYDFPQKDVRTRAINLVVPLLLRIPGFRKEFAKRMKSGMVRPYQKVIER